jgi:hypothetical protein
VIPAKIIQVRQTPEKHRLGQARATVMKINLRAIFGERQCVQIHPEPWFEQIKIARDDQGPVKQANILVPTRITQARKSGL